MSDTETYFHRVATAKAWLDDVLDRWATAVTWGPASTGDARITGLTISDATPELMSLMRDVLEGASTPATHVTRGRATASLFGMRRGCIVSVVGVPRDATLDDLEAERRRARL